MNAQAAPIVIVMGVSGSGKSTLGRALAAHLGWAFQEGDALHPAANIAKMQAGVALGDADRAPWLHNIAAWIDTQIAAGQPGIVTCSALKRIYRDFLAARRTAVRFVYLKGSETAIAARLAVRAGHFMPPGLLASQWADLEPPSPDENALVIDIALPIPAQIEAVTHGLGRSR